MHNSLRIFGLLLYKNLLVRRRHWKLTIFLEVTVPIALFILTQSVRDFSVKPPRIINETKYYDIQTQKYLIDYIEKGLTFLYYVPQNPYTEKIIEDTRNCLHLPFEKVSGFSSESEMLDAYTSLQAEIPLSNIVVVVFQQYNTSDIKYKIRHSWEIGDTLFENIYQNDIGVAYSKYYQMPFVQLQMCVDGSLINATAAAPVTNTMVSIQRMPYPPYVEIDEQDIILRRLMNIFAVIAFLIPLCIEANYPAKEKFIGVNVLITMNGVKQYQNLLSWLVIGTLFSILYVIPISILFKCTFSDNVEAFVYYGNIFIFWLLLTTHVAHLISFGMHIAAYFSKPRFVVTALSIIYTASFSLHGNLINEKMFTLIPYLGILFPNILLFRLFEEVNTYETKLIGIHWSNFFIAGDSDYNITGSNGFTFLFSILGIIIHFTLSVYINALLPGKYGIGKELFYFLKCMKKNKVSLDDEIEDFDYGKINNDDFEPVESGTLIPGIQIRNVKKTYRGSCFKKSSVQALKGISMDLYKGQITALLGHNGAGKTTLMSILTGVTSITEGKVFISGKNIERDLEFIRNDLGLCPQENMFFPDLSVFEQLEFFGLLKGANKTRQEIRRNANILLSKLKLSEKRNVLPTNLSGGQKRRLCLGMALIGDANIVILDEPTSGMDPETRRDTWDIILKMRGAKTILISTHNMEEADILGDRIAIVHGGRLKSYGTSMFLKKQYGHGHIEVTLSTKSWCNAEKVLSKFDPRTQQITLDSEKMVLNVPFTETFPQSLDRVENQKQKLGITGISVSLMTLEQVFLKIIKREDNGRHLNELLTTSSVKVKGWKLHMQVLMALYSKKLTYTRKNLTNLLIIMFLPLLSVLFMSLSYDSPEESTTTHPLNLHMYRGAEVLYFSNNNSFNNAYRDVATYFGGTAKEIVQHTSLIDGLVDYSIKNIAHYRNYLIAAAEFNITDNVFYANAFYSGTAVHSIPLSVNLLSNALIKLTSGSDYSIQTSRQQLPHGLSSTRLSMPEAESLSRTLMFCSFFFPTVALFVVHPYQETSTKIKQLQRMTGLSPISYWITMFTFDFIIYFASTVVIMLGFYIMDIILDIRLYYIMELLIMSSLILLFGINALLIAYIFSFANKSRNTVITILSLAPVALVVVQYLLHNVIQSFSYLHALHLLQKGLLRLVPYISLFHGQLSFFNTAMQNARCRRLPVRLQQIVCSFIRDPCCGLDCVDGNCKSHFPYLRRFETDLNLETSFVYLALTPFLYFAILVLLEERVFLKILTRITGSNLRNRCTVMDEEVKKEKHAVALEISKVNFRASGKGQAKATASDEGDVSHLGPDNESNSLFLVYELSKYYGKLMAVREINFRVKSGECFGLLGVNGAGKSTTFRMLTGEEIPNSGQMYLGNSEIHIDRRNYLAQMGYCPQTDALISSLNAFDHLRLFAALRGIDRSKIDLEVNKWINRLNLNACMSQPSGTYSGGNKRRLNIAMALIGNPKLVLLDEPTTGVDPAARRSLWNILQSCQAMGQAIILTSHSMEECEALCNRLVIMVKGQLVCVGASQELKQRFGAGYDIHIKLNPSRSDDDVNDIKRIMHSSLTCDIRDENLGLIAYHVSDSETSWEKMYGTLNDLKGRYNCIEDYAVLSATLEQLFIQFAREAETSKNETHSTSQAVIV